MFSQFPWQLGKDQPECTSLGISYFLLYCTNLSETHRGFLQIYVFAVALSYFDHIQDLKGAATKEYCSENYIQFNLFCDGTVSCLEKILNMRFRATLNFRGCDYLSLIFFFILSLTPIYQVTTWKTSSCCLRVIIKYSGLFTIHRGNICDLFD